MFDFGILGLNARNLSYLRRFNPSKSVRLADDKFRTKKFLGARGIPFAETYGLIANRAQLAEFDFSQLPSRDFVIKPNKGSKGRGILIAKRLDSTESAAADGAVGGWRAALRGWAGLDGSGPFSRCRYRIGGKAWDDDTLRRHLIDIQRGHHSLTPWGDKVLVEEKLLPGEGFAPFCQHGLADIRVIVFNLVPVAAMIRVPTERSGGKANLAQGGIGMGLDLGTGEIVSMYQDRTRHVGKFPAPYGDFHGRKIPYWNTILTLSSRIQYFTNLGYLALDWVVTDSGPKLLEMNARAGLEIQNACGLRLADRLRKVAGIPVEEPEKGVEIAQSLFSTRRPADDAPVVYLSQPGRFFEPDDASVRPVRCTVEVDLAREGNAVSPQLLEKLARFSPDLVLELPETEARFAGRDFPADPALAADVAVLGSQALADCYVRPVRKARSDVFRPGAVLEDDRDFLAHADDRVSALAKKLELSRLLRPENFLAQLDEFLARGGDYDPDFRYGWPAPSETEALRQEMDALRAEFGGDDPVTSPAARLFLEKLDELSARADLVDAYRDGDPAASARANRRLFGDFDAEALALARRKAFVPDQAADALGRELSYDEAAKAIAKYLEERGYADIPVVPNPTGVSRVSVAYGKEIRVQLSPSKRIREKELEAVMAHEVDVHLARHLAGARTGYKILRQGTGFYLADEEGFAVWNSFRHLPEGYEKTAMYRNYVLADHAASCGFAEFARYARSFGPGVTLEQSFKTAVRFKRGTARSTGDRPGAPYLKDKVYLDGWRRVSVWVAAGGDVARLSVGKVKIADLDLFPELAQK